jgi:hypothetical protein
MNTNERESEKAHGRDAHATETTQPARGTGVSPVLNSFVKIRVHSWTKKR